MDPPAPWKKPSLEERLYEAVNNYDLLMCRDLLSNGVDVNRVTKSGLTALGRAVQMGQLHCAQLMVSVLDAGRRGDVATRRRCDVNLLDSCGRSPLHYAAECGVINILWILLEAGCRVNVADSFDMTPLHLAASDGRGRMCSLGEVIMQRDFVVSHGYAAVVEVLLENGATVNVLDTCERTPLLFAVNRCNREAVFVLLAYGAKVNIEDIHGHTPLAEAVSKNDENMVRMLLNAGAKAGSQSYFLLHDCVRRRNLRLVRLLLDSGWMVNLRDRTGDTPLHIAARMTQLDVGLLDTLLKYGARVNYPNIVTEAVGRIDDHDFQMFVLLLEKLLEHGCRLDAERFTSGDFPLSRAISLGKFRMAAALISYGCDVNKGNHASSINVDNLSLARSKGNLRIAQMLVYGGFDLSRTITPLQMSLHGNNVVEDRDPASSSAASNQLERWLDCVKTNPLNLTDMCRIVIRQNAGYNVHNKIANMPLPSSLKRYLRLEATSFDD